MEKLTKRVLAGAEPFHSLQMRNVSKSFQQVQANQEISFTLQKGEIVAILGENGAGKTTLMKILTGLIPMDTGEILYNQRKVLIKHPNHALELGIGMVHQHFMLINSHTVLDNLILAMKEGPFWLPEKWIKQKLEAFNRQFNFDLPPNAYIWQLSAGQQQKVEIMKVLLRGANVLVLDEPTSVLTPQETQHLFVILKQLQATGKAVIFISHKLEEIMEITNRVIVLRHGIVVGERETKQTNPQELAGLMMGKEVTKPAFKRSNHSSETVLEIQNLEVLSDQKVCAVRKISFSIRSHQIIGIAGVSGNGQKELVEALTGLRQVKAGQIFFRHKPIQHLNARERFQLGIAHIPEERFRYGVVADLNVKENAILRRYEDTDFQKYGFFRYLPIETFTQSIVNHFQVKIPSLNSPVSTLSGGNVQKLILARELQGKPTLLIASHPTYGLDIPSTYAIWDKLSQYREEGTSVLLVSEDLNEVLTLADEVIVMSKGQIMSRFLPGEKSYEQIGLEMAGYRTQTVNQYHD